MTTSTERLAQQIETLRRRQDAFARTPQLPHATLDDASFPAKDADGNPTVIFGKQYDGTFGSITVGGPVPPVPSAPTMSQRVGGVVVHCDGTFPDQAGFTSPVVAPMDFRRFEVEVSADPAFQDGGFGPNRGSITSAAGGDHFVPWPTGGQQLYARLRTRSLSGKLSDPSLTAGPTPSGQVQLGDIGFNLTQYSGGTTVFYGAADPEPPDWGFTAGDVWLREIDAGPPPRYEIHRWSGSAWIKLQDQGVADSFAAAVAAQQAADSKAKIFTQSTEPTYTGAANTAVWFDTGNGGLRKVWNGATWDAQPLGNGSIQPNSLVASNVLATGTVSAALLETTMVLTTSIIAGPPDGTHASMTPTGFHVMREDLLDGIPDEVIRLGTLTNDYFGVVDATGVLVASITDVGVGNFSAVNVTGDAIFGGKDLDSRIRDVGATAAGFFQGQISGTGPGGNFGPIRDRVGIAEVNGMLIAGHRYEISFQTTWLSSVGDDEARFQLTYTGPSAAGSNTAANPLVTSPLAWTWLRTAPVAERWISDLGNAPFVPTTSGRHRFLLSIERGVGTGDLYLVGQTSATAPAANQVTLLISDTGPAYANAGAISQGGGQLYLGPPPPPPPAPTQQYFVELGPNGWQTFRGNGTLRTDTADVIQGWDPSGFNGDGRGNWWFGLPSISGTINNMEFYAYSNHWYYNAGGTAIVNFTLANQGGPNPPHPQTPLFSGGWPKPGGKTIQLPASWWPYFTNSPPGGVRADGISMGPSGSTNLTYYGRFTGNSARLRIWYVQ